MKNLKVRRALLAVGLAAAVTVSSLLLQNYYLRNLNGTQMRLDGFYLEDPNSLDMVILGASDVYSGFSSAQAYSLYGFTSYPYAYESNPVSLWKYELEEILQHQSPKLVVVEVNGAVYDSEELSTEANVRNLVDNIPSSPNRDAVIARYGCDDRLSYDLLLLKYHSKWDHFTGLMGTVNKLMLDRRGYTVLKGVYSNTEIDIEGEARDLKGDLAAETLDPEAEACMEEFLDCCKAHDTRVLFVRFPHRVADEAGYSRYLRSNEAGALAQAKGYEYLNLEQYKDQMGIDDAADFYNNEHMNADGQRKLTAFLGAYIRDHYGLSESQLDAAQKDRWEMSADYIGRFYQYYEAHRGEETNRLIQLLESVPLLHELDKM